MPRTGTATGASLRALPWLTLLLAGLGAMAYLALGPAPEALVYRRDAVATGEWWRLVAGHWVHTDAGHLGWNLTAWLLLGWLVESRSRAALLAGLAAGTLAVDLVLWFGLPQLAAYCGLSGMLNAVLLVALWVLRGTAPGALPRLVGLLSLGKILFEWAAGTAVFTHTAWASVPQAHLAGWLGGVCLVGLLALGATAQRRSQRDPAARLSCPLLIRNDPITRRAPGLALFQAQQQSSG